MLFNQVMEDARDSLNRGDFEGTIDMYQYVLEHADKNTNVASVHQLMGIAYRLNGDFDLALVSLQKAFDLTESEHDRARIKRDMGMVRIDMLAGLSYIDNPIYAVDVILKASEDLWSARLVFINEKDETEEGATVGFIGRLEYTKDRRLRHNKALTLMREADDILRRGNNRDYELNNLVWLMRLVPIKERAELYSRGLELVKLTGQSRRTRELKIIRFTGDLGYRIAKRLAKRAL